MIGLGLSLTGQRTSASLASLLFGMNEPGFTFEPWDITTLYQDRAGTTPVTAAGQSVGLRLSKDQGLRIGPELVTNGDFSDGSTGWYFAGAAPLGTVSGGAATFIAGTGNRFVGQTGKLTVGKTYLVTATFTVTAGTIGPDMTGYAANYSVSGTYTWRLLASITSINFLANSAFIGSIDNISVRELTGNHQVAVSDAKRGIYGWMPKTGRRNLLTYTEQFDNAVWVKGELTVSANAAVAPDGATTADKLVESVNNAGRGAYYNPASSTAVTLSQNVTFTTYIKAAERGFGGMTAVDGGNNRYYLVANLSTGSEVASGFANGSTTVVSKSITNVGGGWYRLQVTLASGSSGNAFMWVYPQDDATFSTSTTGNAIYQGDGISGIYVWGAQLETGSSATAYQRVVSQYDVTEAGVQTCYYVQADGVDDAYVTPTITPGTDKVQVFAGVRKLSDAALGMVVEFSANVNTNNGTFWLTAPMNAGVASYDFASKGTIVQSKTSTGFAAPISSVLAGLGDISGDRATLRVNGTQVGQSVADQGTGNYLAYPAYIYSRGGTSLPFNGLDFGHAVRFGPNLDAATIARVEALIARNTPGVTL